RGGFPAETVLGERSMTKLMGMGGKEKLKLLRERYVNVSHPSGKTEKLEILRVISNRANVDYNRTGIITRGAVVETPAGNARVTSKPGRDGTVNAVLI
ncbi:MAG: 30S ribosomal protein S8e, partial [Candidatus Bathyarchaeia archaeon]